MLEPRPRRPFAEFVFVSSSSAASDSPLLLGCQTKVAPKAMQHHCRGNWRALHLDNGLVADLGIWVAVSPQNLHSSHHGRHVHARGEGVERDVALNTLGAHFLSNLHQAKEVLCVANIQLVQNDITAAVLKVVSRCPLRGIFESHSFVTF